MSGNEAVSSEIVASAHIENYAMKLFEWADKEDRAARFGKNVVKSFYTAGNLFDIMHVFGELTPEILHARKYRCRPCPLIQILSRFYPDFILSFEKVRIKSG